MVIVKTEAQPVNCPVLEGGPCSVCKERAIIHQKIKQLEEEIAILKANNHALGSPMNAIHDPFIHKLPPEIGSHVFRLCLPNLDYRGANPSVIQRGLAGVLRLGAVCRKWRQLAWATPDLWKTIYLAMRPSMALSLVESLPGLIHEWLGRSGVLPLTIVFNYNHPSVAEGPVFFVDSNKDTIEDVTEFVMDILNPESGRWQNLHLNADADIFEYFYGSTLEPPMQLIGIDLTMRSLVQSQSRKPEFEMEFAPNPTHLKLTNFPLTSINIGWKNVTHATLDAVNIEEGVDLLRRAPNLEHYCVSIAGLPPNTIEFVSPILHPRLHSLDLRTTHTVKNFLEAITLPSLKQWVQDMDDAPIPTLTILSLLKLSNCCLKILQLSNLPSPTVDLYNLLQGIPTLEHLRLHFHWKSSDFGIMDDILAHIFCSVPGSSKVSAETTTPEALLPRLQSIDCTAQHAVPFTWDCIPQLYRQSHRWSITLKSTSSKLHIRDKTALQLLQLVEEGVDLQIAELNIGGDFLKNFKNRPPKQGAIRRHVIFNSTATVRGWR